jgi:BirA family transcriptional regulator, biotin operon repressor / biotin---[acetyl-CoA-carboxylase] ligase
MIGSTIVRVDCVDSTNNYAAKELLTKSLKEGTVFVANCQHSGRGMGQASWESAAGLNLTFSIVVYPKQVAISRQFSISIAISLGVADFLTKYIGGVSIKWPNDIYVGNKKIAGILIETAISGGKFTRVLVGIGLNINQKIFISDAPNPISLKNLTGETYELSQMLTDLCNCLDNRYRSLISEDYSILQHDYGKLLYLKGVWANYKEQNSVFEGKILGIEEDGRLQIETRKGEVRGFYFKEVAFL